MRILVLAALVALGVSAPAFSEEGWGYDLANELMSPYCPGRALTECPSPQAAKMREWILDQERAGVSREAVEAELYRNFGDQLRQSPRAEGVGLLAYALPAGLFLGGGALVAVFLRRQRSGSPTAPPDHPRLEAVDPDLERELEAELADD